MIKGSFLHWFQKKYQTVWGLPDGLREDKKIRYWALEEKKNYWLKMVKFYIIFFHLLPSGTSVTIGYHWLKLVTIGYQLLPSVTISYHQLPSVTFGYHRLPSVTIGYCRLPLVKSGYLDLYRLTLVNIGLYHLLFSLVIIGYHWLPTGYHHFRSVSAG